jgi:hypothetical protein
MTKDDIIKLAKKVGLCIDKELQPELIVFSYLVAAAERAALEAELLKLKKGIAANSEYIQGRWDLIGEFQDAIRARGNT